MQYTVKRSGTGYRVFQEGTDKSFSSKPLSKAAAEAQQRAIYSGVHNEARIHTMQFESVLNEALVLNEGMPDFIKAKIDEKKGKKNDVKPGKKDEKPGKKKDDDHEDCDE